jgi:uncharacterized protein (DUF2384 family)
MSAKTMTKETSKSKRPEAKPAGGDEPQNKAVCKAIFLFQRDLNITNSDLAGILGVHPRTLGRWREAGRIANFASPRVREPISHFIAVVAALSSMFGHRGDREAWLRTPHPDLLKAPLDLMGEGPEQLADVRRYLDYVVSLGA